MSEQPEFKKRSFPTSVQPDLQIAGAFNEDGEFVQNVGTVDEDGNAPVPVFLYGGERTVNVANSVSKDLLEEILYQLKVMNVHLQSMTDETIGKGQI